MDEDDLPARAGGRRPTRADVAYFGWLGLLSALSVASAVVAYGSVRLAVDVAGTFPDSAGVTWLLLGTIAALCAAALPIPVVFGRRALADRRAGRAGDIGVRALLHLFGYAPLLLLLVGILLRR